MNPTLRVIKVGGSLFDLPDLAERLRKWCAAQSPGINVLLAGAGAWGDLVRTVDARFSLGDEPAHEMCIDALAITARLLATLLPEAPLVSDEQLLQHRQAEISSRPTCVFHATEFLREREGGLPGETLPVGWDVTSDSIAARLAEVTHADDFVLLKSKLPGPFSQVDQLAAANYVDRYFPWAMRGEAEVRFVNLRHDHFPEVYAFE